MKKEHLIFYFGLILIFTLLSVNGQENEIYYPEADALKDISQAVEKAKIEGKHVLIQVGGNWCPWCIRLHKYYSSEAEVATVLRQNYILVLLNYSKENKNLDILEKLGYPQRFGFPVLIVLNGEGKRLHTQDSGLLESGGDYSKKKVLTFLKGWTVSALDPVHY